MRFAAGLRLDPLGELQRFPRPPSRNRGRGPTSKGKGGNGRKRERGGKEEGRGREQRGDEGKGRGLPPIYLTFGYGPEDTTHTAVQRPFFRDYPGEPVPER